MTQPREIELLGVSFRTAPAAVREQLSFDVPAAAVLLRTVAEELPGCDALLLSTCNRSEFYLVPPSGAPGAVDSFLALLRRRRPEAPMLRADCPRYRLTGTEAVRHLARVACGLDSQILGDGQILGQVRAAVATARAAGTVGPVLDGALRYVLRAAKRVRRDTALGVGSASIGSAVAGMVATFDPRTTVVVGAGAVARDVCRHLAKHDVGPVVIVNRTHEAARALARDAGAEARPWAELADALAEADVVVTATSASAPVIGSALADQVLARRLGRALVVIDTGLPRNVAPGIGLSVFDVDAIREQCGAVVAAREAAVPAVEALVDEAVARYEGWQRTRATDAAIEALFGRATHVSREAADVLAGEPRAPEDIERVFLTSFKRLMHDHLRALRGRGRDAAAVAVGR